MPDNREWNVDTGTTFIQLEQARFQTPCCSYRTPSAPYKTLSGRPGEEHKNRLYFQYLQHFTELMAGNNKKAGQAHFRGQGK